ncbi:lipid-binding SYLF domain-containing protein, partial [Caballeronia terrestris]|uniref:lipid-binding SYLF domain-containing protein n=1 Tax=Caballeronia terrestris TaxID=1226301 RepID=UPI000AD41314
MTKTLRLILAIPLVLFLVACSTQQTSTTGSDPELEGKARVALQRLNDAAPRTRDLLARSKAVLVFPDIVKAGLLLGAQGGNGVMFDPNGQVLGYYNNSAASYGLQAGAQTFSQAMFLM